MTPLNTHNLPKSMTSMRDTSNYAFLEVPCPHSPLDDSGKKKFRCTPRGTKVVIYHLVGNFMLNSMQNVVSLATCAESL